MTQKLYSNRKLARASWWRAPKGEVVPVHFACQGALRNARTRDNAVPCKGWANAPRAFAESAASGDRDDLFAGIHEWASIPVTELLFDREPRLLNERRQ